jgi:hypothetical protein
MIPEGKRSASIAVVGRDVMQAGFRKDGHIRVVGADAAVGIYAVGGASTRPAFAVVERKCAMRLPQLR